MKLSDARAAYDAFCSKTSEIARQLSFAGIALIWIFKPEDAPVTAIPPQMLCPAILFVIALALDLLHAAYGALAWGAFNRIHERNGVTDDDNLDAPPYINWPSLFFFWGKVAAVIAAYAYTLAYIWSLANGP